MSDWYTCEQLARFRARALQAEAARERLARSDRVVSSDRPWYGWLVALWCWLSRPAPRPV